MCADLALRRVSAALRRSGLADGARTASTRAAGLHSHEVVRWRPACGGAGRNLDRLATSDVLPAAGRALARAEGAEARQCDCLAGLQLLLNGCKRRVHHRLDLFAGQARRCCGNIVDQGGLAILGVSHKALLS